MTPARAKQIRSQIKHIPHLTKAGLISQAFELEKVIGYTFDPSADFRGLMRNIPQNYIEKINGAYRNLCYRAYEAGRKHCELKPEKSGALMHYEGPELKRQIKVTMPMSSTLLNDFVASFDDDCSTLIKTIPDFGSISLQVKKDLEAAYYMGISDALEERLGEATEEMSEEEGPQMSQRQQTKEAEPMKVSKIKEENGDLRPNAFAAPGQPVEAPADPGLSKLEEYTKKLNDPTAEKVLRYVLGLPPQKMVSASTKKSIVQSVVLGPYDVDSLREKILHLIQAHRLTHSDLQSVVVDCILPNSQDLSSQELANVLAERLEIEDFLPSRKTVEDVHIAADTLAEEITAEVGLPGDLVFVDLDDSYCLTFNFPREKSSTLHTMISAIKEVRAARRKSRIKSSGSGVISQACQREIKALHDAGKIKSMKELKKASAKAARHVSQILSDIRQSRVGIAEGAKALRLSVPDIVEAVWGDDGLNYFEYLQGSK